MSPRALLTAALAAVAAAAPLATAPTAKTAQGPVTGKTLDSGVNEFLGIPFAESPPLRFGAPKEPNAWTEALDATNYKPSCITQFNYPEKVRNFTIEVFNMPIQPESEDCLYLNVWSPSGPAPKGGFPVMVWIYGGNLQAGAASLPVYNGEKFALQRDVVLVNINYRTNVFGFPNSPELPNGEANPGFLDQRLALKWVQANIASFSGNPAQVTIFGESAGAWSVKQLVALPPNPLPFRAAILESNAMGVTGGETSYTTLLKATNCTFAPSPLTCLRAVPAEAIKDTIERANLGFDPVADEITRTADVAARFTSGKAAKVPLIIGSNADDGSAFAGIFGGLDFAATSFPATAAAVTALTFQCPAAELADHAAKSGYDVYRYVFDVKAKSAPFPHAGAWHSFEIGAVFRTYNESELARVSGAMQGRWADLAYTGQPAGWPKVTAGEGPVLVFGEYDDQLVGPELDDKVGCKAMKKDVLAAGL
ncbi:alpha/beta-hydrolase [Trichodelitschia bisporula]|uniref:Alpha/beta-hydrolase n=1 Tax=Trichodelitschia bisporula TaxID=703511 RepID=A0A6G1HY58_9PEZI|nr:alpha/beta-hydrolase [Trichodelitschia bisporula]